MTTPTQVPYDLLTRGSLLNRVFSGEASDLGWAPGVWPRSIWAVSPSGHGEELPCIAVEADGTHVYRAGSSTVRIFND